MTFSLESLRSQLSAIEPNEATYDQIGSSEIPLLQELLSDNEEWMAARAVTALVRISDPEAVRLLKQVATDPRPEVRTAVALCASKVVPEEANEILITLLDDSEAGVRKAAIRSVSAEHSQTVRNKLQAIESNDPVNRLREMANARVREMG